jgi:hypothetical protein
MNEMLCRQGCRDYSFPMDIALSRLLDLMLDPADHWREKLLAAGTPVTGNVRFAVQVREKVIHSGVYFEWPLARPIEVFAVDTSPTIEDEDYEAITTGDLAEGADAVELRELRARASATASNGSQTAGWIAINGPDGFFYEVVVADVLPYEDATGVVPRFVDRASRSMPSGP